VFVLYELGDEEHHWFAGTVNWRFLQRFLKLLVACSRPNDLGTFEKKTCFVCHRGRPP